MGLLCDFLLCLCAILIYYPIIIDSSPQGQLVDKWAQRIGKELYDLGLIITKAQEIEDRYRFNNAQVQKKDHDKLLNEIVGSVGRMLNRKMDAIKCIVRAAEDEAETFVPNSTYSYHSSKYSQSNNDNVTLPDSIKRNSKMYLPLDFNIDSHFYNIAVNTSYSSVHLPTNVFDGHAEASFAIQWSEKLDEVFEKNYKSDPALSWQYFGSSTGMMRHYPAMRWTIDGRNDSFDCRVRTWYIEAATCSKDIIILVDDSGSMAGMNKHIAALTVYTILSTLSNNDYVNILNYSTTVNYTVPCFKEKLIQATPENILTFKIAVSNLEPKDKSNVELGLIESFRLLEKYRKKRNCTENNSDCNQAIMLITDGVTRNFTNLLLKYNSINNGSMIPVRIFTYLIGKEINNLKEITSISCLSRGYYSHVGNLEQVTAAVFKYINVIARPLILQAEDHPISWTHTYIDIYTYDEENEHHTTEPYRLLTSAAIPAYDRKDNVTGDVQLLGVAGTDVTIDSIQKLTFPYKLGVNAHAFIVTNNGYVLMHPGLRPMFKGEPTLNYNSIDFTEVQQLDDGSEPRELAQILLDLRAALVNGETNVTRNVPLKYHYNNMQRVSRENFDFFYAKLNDTPFTMALALPNRFGYYAVQVPDEINNNKHARVSILSFFDGNNWKIHPRWVYCKYHYLEGHEFDTPEQELLHFLGRMYNKNFKWTQQYEVYDTDNEVECDTETKRLGQNDYYCDKELINMLVFDAKSTLQAFKESWTFKNDREEGLFKRYNATLRFVATMSGLTRWDYIFGEGNNTNKKEFGDYHSRAIDETWYKSAVIQHQYDGKSFVYSVPLYPDSIDDLLVTSSYAIFPKDAGIEAPASVVGFQFSHSHLNNSFFNIAVDNAQCEDCVPCGDHLDCYIIDSSGYIIISYDDSHVGRFIGEIEGCVLESMLELNIFETLPIYDYQSSCLRKISLPTKGSKCSVAPGNTFSIMQIINWLIQKIFWLFIETNLYQTWYPLKYVVLSADNGNPTMMETEDIPATEHDDKRENKTQIFVPCDQKKNLYILNQTLFNSGKSFVGEIPTKCETKSYYAKAIPKSNLLLVAVRYIYIMSEVKYTTKPEKIVYENNTEHPCQKLELNSLPRRRLTGCYNSHPLEEEITACGYSLGVSKHIHSSTILFLILIGVHSLNLYLNIYI